MCACIWYVSISGILAETGRLGESPRDPAVFTVHSLGLQMCVPGHVQFFYLSAEGLNSDPPHVCPASSHTHSAISLATVLVLLLFLILLF